MEPQRTPVPPGDPINADPRTLFALGELIAGVRELGDRLEDMARRLHRGDELSVAERELLLILRREGPLTIPGLAARKGASRQYVRQALLPLEARRLVARRPNPAHKRSQLVVLTAEGGQMVRRVMRREGDLLRRLAVRLRREPVADAAGVLRQVQDLLGTAHADDEQARGSML